MGLNAVNKGPGPKDVNKVATLVTIDEEDEGDVPQVQAGRSVEDVRQKTRRKHCPKRPDPVLAEGGAINILNGPSSEEGGLRRSKRIDGGLGRRSAEPSSSEDDGSVAGASQTRSKKSRKAAPATRRKVDRPKKDPPLVATANMEGGESSSSSRAVQATPIPVIVLERIDVVEELATSGTVDSGVTNQSEAPEVDKAFEFVAVSYADTADLYSDSLSSLQLLSNPMTRDPLVERIKTQYRSLLDKGCKVKLHWVKAHVGLVGNEAADELAKAQTKEERITWHFPPHISNLKRGLRRHALFSWQQSWDYSNKARPIHEFFPTVDLKRLVTGNLAQLASGHGKFPEYFNRFGYNVSAECLCGLIGTSRHFLTECELTEHMRSKFVLVRGELSSLFHPVNLTPLREIAELAKRLLPDIPARN